MPVYEVEIGGKTYEADASSPEEAVKAARTFHLDSAGQESVARAEAGAKARSGPQADPVRDAFMDPKHLYRWGTAGQDAADVHPSTLSDAEQNKGAALATAGAVLPAMAATVPTTIGGLVRMGGSLAAGGLAEEGLRLAGAPPWLRAAGGIAVGGMTGVGGKLLKFGRAAANPLGYTDEAAMSYLRQGAKAAPAVVERAAPGVVQSVPMAAQKAAGATSAALPAVEAAAPAAAPTIESIVAQGAGKAAPSVSGEALAFAEKLQGTVAALKGQGLSPGQIASAVREANPGLGETVARKMVDDILAVQRTLPKTTAPLLSSGTRAMGTNVGGKAQPYLGPARVPTDDADLLALLGQSIGGR